MLCSGGGHWERDGAEERNFGKASLDFYKIDQLPRQVNSKDKYVIKTSKENCGLLPTPEEAREGPKETQVFMKDDWDSFIIEKQWVYFV